MPDVVVCNTSPLFYLHRIGHLDLLQKLYHEIIIPTAVVDELEAGRLQGEDVPTVDQHPWIDIRSARVPKVLELITDFGPGEVQVLALAMEESDALVILDDLLAREVAQFRGLRLTGTAGVLLKAKQNGYIKALAPLLDKLVAMNFRLSDNVKTHILQLANE